ncbi:class I SAM-dependent methyltransferase [Parasphingorhabdus pacifica]
MSNLHHDQQDHWQSVYTAHPDMYGWRPSEPAQHAAEVFRTAGARTVLELGAGHGRDALHFARCGFTVPATDFSSTGLEQLRVQADHEGLGGYVAPTVCDVRDRLPLATDSVDAVFAHMLLCMALSTAEIHVLVTEIHRVLQAGGTLIYTVRHTGDAHYGTGTAHGDDIFEHGGFAVHFFSRSLVDALADGWHLHDVHPFAEGELPRRLWRITQTIPTETPHPRVNREVRTCGGRAGGKLGHVIRRCARPSSPSPGGGVPDLLPPGQRTTSFLVGASDWVTLIGPPIMPHSPAYAGQRRARSASMRRAGSRSR